MIFQSDQRLKGYSGARAVIIGGLGLIGSAIARRLVLLDAEVLLIDSMIPEYGGNLANIADIWDRVTVNIADIRGGYGLPPLLNGQDFLFNLERRRVISIRCPHRKKISRSIAQHSCSFWKSVDRSILGSQLCMPGHARSMVGPNISQSTRGIHCVRSM